MVGAAGNAIMLVCSVVALTMATVFFTIFTSHYVLTTFVDSAAGHKEVNYPSESFMEWWWKPLLFAWVLLFWMLTAGVFLIPLLAIHWSAYVIGFGLILWILYPLSLVSVLHSHNWFFFLQPVLLWRMVKHFPSLAYTCGVTLLSFAIGAATVYGMFAWSLFMILPAAIVIPAVILFHARTWGRFFWLSMNFAARKAKRKKSAAAKLAAEAESHDPWSLDAPSMDVEEVEEEPVPAEPVPADAIASGLPPSSTSQREEDEWATEKKPYAIGGGADQPSFEEFEYALDVPSEETAAPVSAPSPIVEEEDEWSTNKKPYGVIDEPTPAQAASANSQTAPKGADAPLPVSEYFDERDRKEKAAKRRAQADAETPYLPTPSRKTPTFYKAFIVGTAEFMFAGPTVHVWGNLALLTVFELFFGFLVASFIGSVL